MNYYIQIRDTNTGYWDDMGYSTELNEAKKILSKAREESPNYEYRIVMEIDE